VYLNKHKKANYIFFLSDDDLSLDCLAANVSSKSKYILVFPVDCQAKIADTVKCAIRYKEQQMADSRDLGETSIIMPLIVITVNVISALLLSGFIGTISVD